MRTVIALMVSLCCVGVRVRPNYQIQSQSAQTSREGPPRESRLVGKAEMEKWKEWKEKRTRWKRLRTWFAWGVLNRGPQRAAMEAEFNSIFHRLVEGNPILDAAQALICVRTTSKERDQPPHNILLRVIKLECSFPVSLFDLEDAYPRWKERFGIYTRYNNTMGVLESLKSLFKSAVNRTADALPVQRIKFVVSDVRSYPYLLGSHNGIMGGRYDDPYVMCLGGGLQKSAEDRSLPPDALAKRCIGFLGTKELDDMANSLIKSVRSGRRKSKRRNDKVKQDIKYMAQWLILSGFDGKKDEFDSQDISKHMITKSNKLGILKLVVGNWHALYEVGKLFASAWLDRLEGKQMFLPVEQLVDLNLISESSLKEILLPLGAFTDSQGQDTVGEQQWENMAPPERRQVVAALAAESHRLATTVSSLDETMKLLAAGTKNNKEIALQLKNLAKNECRKLESKSDECIALLKSYTSSEHFSSELKRLAADIAKVEGAEAGTTELLSLGARAVEEKMDIELHPVLYDHVQLVNTGPLFNALGGVRHAVQKVDGVSHHFFPKFTQNIEHRVHAMNEAIRNSPHEYHQNVHIAHDLMPGSATVAPSFDMQATERWGGLADYMETGNPDHMHASIHMVGQLGLHEDGVITGAVNTVDGVSQGVVGALDHASSASPLCAYVIQGLQKHLAHHALNGTAANAAHSLTGHMQGVAYNTGMAQHLSGLWPDTLQRNLWLHTEEGLKHHFQSSIDQIDWLQVDDEVRDSIHNLNALVKFLHPHVDAHVKYDVLGSVKIVDGQLELHEIVKLHPDVAIHSGFLTEVAHLSPLDFFAASTPLLHCAWLVYRIGSMLLNLNWYWQMNDLMKTWNEVFHDGEEPTACVCQDELSWPATARARNPHEKWRKEKAVERVGKFWTSQLEAKTYQCSDICEQVSRFPDGTITPEVRDTWIDEELNERQEDPRWLIFDQW